MSNGQNRPKPNVGQGQQKVDTAVETQITPVADIPVPDLNTKLVSSPADESAIMGPDLREVNKALALELEEAKSRLADIRSIINNPFHVMGYLVNLQPIEKALSRPYVPST